MIGEASNRAVADFRDSHFVTSSYRRTLLSCVLTASIVSSGVALVWAQSAQTYGLEYSTFFGGSGTEAAQIAYQDRSGNLYLAGPVLSSGLATPGAFDTTYNDGGLQNDSDAFFVKFNASGTRVCSTYIGTSEKEYVHSLVVDDLGAIYVTGATQSASYPTTAGAYDRTYNGGLQDWFVSKFSADCRTLLWSTLLGGSGEEYDRSSIALDASRNVYLLSKSSSTNLPTTGGTYDPSYNGGSYDGYVAVISANGSSLLHATYLGGSGNDELISGIQVHSDGAVYVSGSTDSADFPMVGSGYDRSYNGGRDAVVAKFNSTLTSLIWSTYLGGSGDDNPSENHGFTIDAAGRPILSGSTQSTNLPVTAGAFQTTNRGGFFESFVAILSANGASLVALSYLGGTGTDHNDGVAIDNAGNVYTTGNTGSSDFPVTSNAIRASKAGSAGVFDIFITKFSPDLRTLLFSSYFGGSQEDRGRGIAVDPQSGRIIIAGDTLSNDYPVTSNATQATKGGDRDYILSVFRIASSSSVPTPQAPQNLRIIP